MNRKTRRRQTQARRRLKLGPMQTPFAEVPEAEWPPFPAEWVQPLRVWRNEALLVVLYDAVQLPRLSIQTHNGTGDLSWDLLQWVKEQLIPGTWCVEAYPPDMRVQNVANIRHLRVLPAEWGPLFDMAKDKGAS